VTLGLAVVEKWIQWKKIVAAAVAKANSCELGSVEKTQDVLVMVVADENKDCNDVLDVVESGGDDLEDNKNVVLDQSSGRFHLHNLDG
jgi:hypothetical protein